MNNMVSYQTLSSILVASHLVSLVIYIAYCSSHCATRSQRHIGAQLRDSVYTYITHRPLIAIARGRFVEW